VTVDLAVPDASPGCEELLLCGQSATQTLGFAGATGSGELIAGRRGVAYGFVELRGVTSRATVRTPDGLACTEETPVPAPG
jgi:hypothetical protein